MQSIKEQFGDVSSRYDAQRHSLIPCFEEFYTAGYPLIKRMNHPRTVLDLGAGTGLFSQFVRQIKPDLSFTLADLSLDMLHMAKERFKGLPHVEYIEFDFASDAIPGTYDLIISALAIHHLDDETKEMVYRKIYGALSAGGVFINADQVAGRSAGFDQFYKTDWQQTVRQSGLDEDAIGKAFERVKLDKFATLDAQLQMLDRAGFTEVDCFYKNLNFVVFGGVKGPLN